MHREVRRKIEAAIETGQFDQALTYLTEYSEVHPKEAKALRLDLIPKYGTHFA